jgi:hypothetical protein
MVKKWERNKIFPLENNTDEPILGIRHIYREMSQWKILHSHQKQTKMSFLQNEGQEGKTNSVWGLLPVGGERHKERAKEREYGGSTTFSCVKMEETWWNYSRWGEGDKGKIWRTMNLRYIVNAFVNVTRNPQYNYNMQINKIIQKMAVISIIKEKIWNIQKQIAKWKNHPSYSIITFLWQYAVF